MTQGGRGRGRGRGHGHEHRDGAGEAYRVSLLTRNETHASNRAYRNVSFI
jgi:hypothetical protein